MRQIVSHDAEALAVAYSPDGKQLLTSGRDRTVRLWDSGSGKQIYKLVGHGDPAVSPRKGSVIASWRAEQVQAVAFSPDGKLAASGGDDWTLRIWDTETGREIRCIEDHVAPILCVAFSPDGKYLASGGNDKENRLRLWDAATGEQLQSTPGHSGWVGAFQLAADRKTLLTAGSDGTIRRWGLTDGKMLSRFEGKQSRGKAIAFSGDGRLAATGGSDGMIRLFDPAAAKETAQMAAHDGAVNTLIFTEDGKTLVSGGLDQRLKVWDVATGKERNELPRQSAAIFSFAIAPDGKTLAVGTKNGGIALFDLATAEQVQTIAGQTGPIESLVFLENGRLLLSGGSDARSRVHLWQLATGEDVSRLPRLKAMVYGLSLSPDGRTLAVSATDRKIHLWEMATGQVRAQLAGHHGATVMAQFLPDGKSLISGSSDGTALIWNLAGGTADKPLSPSELDAAWKTLTGPNAASAYRAMWTLANVPGQVQPLLDKHLKPVAFVDEKRVARLLAELDDDDFATREKASEELAELGAAAEAPLRTALDDDPPIEVRIRVQAILSKLGTGGASHLSAERRLELLEQLQTPEAERLLAALADGAPEARLTRAAQAALERRGESASR